MRKLLVALVVIAGLAPTSVALSQTPSRADVLWPPPATIPPAEAQADGATFRSLFSDLKRELGGLPSKSTAITLGLGGAFALAAHPADRTLTERAALSVPLDRALEVGESAGSGWAQGGAALTTFLVGRATGNRRVQSVGADLVQAQIVTSIMTQGLKIAVGRTRPDNGRYSFPSGHSSGTFANATVLHRHFGWKVGLPAYGLATYVAASRLQENRHFASDVIFGAAIGIVAGRTVTVGRGRGTFTLAPVALRGGAGVMFTRVP
jgi:hypothetical protein